MDLLIGLDLGTSAVKGVLVSADGRQIAEASRSAAFLYSLSGFVELDSEAHYRSVCDLIRYLASKASSGNTIRALSMAAANGNTLLLDEEAKPITNIISWLDDRSKDRTPELLPYFDMDSVHPVVG